jgi:hypothetical protein
MRRIDLGERPLGREELSRWYATALAAQASSGLSMADYAVEIGVTAATLYQWRRRLSSRVVASQGGGGPRLVEVTVAPDGVGAADPLVVRVAGGRRTIEVPRGFDSEDLRRLVTVLESC